MAIEATDILLAMPGNLPFLECSFVTVLADLGGDGQRHFGTFLGMPLAHDAMAGLTGDPLMGEGLGFNIRSGGVTNQAGNLASYVLPGFLEAFGKSHGMR